MLSVSVFESVFNIGPTGEYILTPEPDPVILAVNDAFLKASAREREDLVNVRLFVAFPENPEDTSDTGIHALRNSLTRVIQTGKPDELPMQRYPIRMVAASGEEYFEERFWNAISIPIFDDGKLSCILHRTTDVTDQVRSKDELRNSELRAEEFAELARTERWRLDTVLEVAPVGIALVDMNGKFLTANPENFRIWGEHPFSKDAGEYGEWKAWWADGTERHGQPVKAHEWALARALKGEETNGDILEIESFDMAGTRRTVLLRAAPIRNAQQAIFGAVAVIMDISEQVKAGAELRESEARFRTITDAMPQMVWAANRDGLNDYTNRQWRAFSGVSEESLRGNGWNELIYPGDRERLWNIWRNSLSTGQEYEIEHRIRHYSGVYRWVLNRALPLRDHTGKVIRWMGTVTDIHEHKLAQHALEEADKRKDEFLAMLAHELRTPLAPISAAADLLQMSQLDEERVRQTSTIIARQIRHMTGLVDDLLDISRVTRGLIRLNKAKLDAKRIVFEAAEQVMPLIESRAHRLAMHTPPESAFVLGDQKRLVQVVSNLLNNAVKYTPEGGEITLAMEVEGRRVKISVADNGIGMASDLVTRVFELFTQAERSSDRSQGGLGIGLALVKSLVELHGGTVTAYSEGPGKGSRFTVCLPQLPENNDATAYGIPSPAKASPVQPLRVMIVDDNADAGQMLAMFVEALGHKTIVEQQPEAALDLAITSAPDVFLLDIGLPGMDGYELARRLRAQPELAGITLIAITGYGREQDRREALQAGFNHHFAKPVDTGRLAELLCDIGKLCFKQED